MKNKLLRLSYSIIVISLLFNLFLFFILFTPLTEFLYKFLIVDEMPQKCSVIVVLSSVDGFDTEKGSPDLATYSRINKTVELYQKGYSDKIICVGGKIFSKSKKTYAQIMEDVLVNYGIPSENIFLQDEIAGDFNYYKNLVKITDKFKDKFDFKNFMIITAPQNTYRIKKAFKKINLSPIIVSSDKYALSPSNWHERFGFFRDILNEYWAIVLFKIIGRI